MKTISAILLILLLALFALGYRVFQICFTRKTKKGASLQKENRPHYYEQMSVGREWFLSQPYEEVYIRSFDGLKLHGYYLPSAGSTTTLILMHGYHSGALREFAPLLRFYHENGFNLLLPHQRAHGDSDGKYISFGLLERNDVKTWCEYINENFAPNAVFLSGISMGGTTVAMSTLLPLPNNVKGVIADCPFNKVTDILKYDLKDLFHLPSFPLLYFCDCWCKILIGVHFNEVKTEDYTHAKLPLLWIHGTNDATVPHHFGQKLWDAYGGPKEMLLIEGAGHAYAGIHSPECYHNKVLEFIYTYR